MSNRRGSTVSRRTFMAGLVALTALRLELPATAAPPAPFSFIFVCDTHLVNGLPDTGEKMLQESQLFLQEAVKQFNLLRPDFIVFGGDMVEQVGKDEANWLLFGDIVQHLEAPWTFVLGEDDVSGRVPPDKMRTFGSDWRARGIESSNPYWSLDPVPGVHIVGLDTSVPNATKGQLSEAQLNWLKDDLLSNKGKFTVVFAHHPLLPPPPYDGAPPWSDYSVSEGADAREIFGANRDVRLVVTGHLYTNKVQNEREVWHASCAGLAVYPCQYKLFRVSKDSIIMESFQVNYPALVKKARKALLESNRAYKYNSRSPEEFVRLCEGQREDQNAILPLSNSKTPQPLGKKDKRSAPSAKEKGKKKSAGSQRKSRGNTSK